MTTEAHTLTISGVRVAVVRKAIKNLHLGVYPPDGRVRIAAPLAVSDAAVRVAVIGRLRWIRQQQARFHRQERQSDREMVSGESHYYLGRRLRLRVIEAAGASRVVVKNRTTLVLIVPPGTNRERRERTLNRWYRERLRDLVPPILAEWQTRLGVEVAAWGIKKMKTKWGSCNAAARRIWLNLELAKKSPGAIEYILVHELVHLRARRHDGRFTALMDRWLPRWRQLRTELNAAPLANEAWAEG